MVEHVVAWRIESIYESRSAAPVVSEAGIVAQTICTKEYSTYKILYIKHNCTSNVGLSQKRRRLYESYRKLRNSLGETPKCCMKAREKCAWLEKPAWRAISERVKERLCMSCLACSSQIRKNKLMGRRADTGAEDTEKVNLAVAVFGGHLQKRDLLGWICPAPFH